MPEIQESDKYKAENMSILIDDPYGFEENDDNKNNHLTNHSSRPKSCAFWRLNFMLGENNWRKNEKNNYNYHLWSMLFNCCKCNTNSTQGIK